ncbi:MAG: NUDIX domain-containing protein [Lactobacillus sp.]|jgi:ADP-ribose pyrophosphatase YjhB (NUDIX family)|nr:MAG: NUDIX domain-containing protein [Lactobacillus sp.]
MDYIKSIRNKVGHDPVILVFAGGILADPDNRILLQKRADFPQWGLIGGALEYGETAIQACIREFKEETGLDVTVDQLLGVSTDQIRHYPNGDVVQCVVVSFVVHQVGGRLNSKNDETLDLAYFPSDQLPPIFNQQHQKCIGAFRKRQIGYFD